MKKVNVSVVLYNNDIEELKTAINCALGSELVDKVILIDNSETDSLKILKDLNPDRITYFFQNENMGFGSAHNVSIKISIENKTKYHLILNPDVEFSSDILQELYNYMEKNTDCGMVTPKIFYKTGELQRLCKRIPTFIQLYGKRIFPKKIKNKINARIELHDFGYDTLLNVPYLSGCFMFCRTEALNKVDGFDDRYFMYMEDLDLTRSIHRYYKTIFYPNVSIIHGYRNESKTNRKLLKALIISSIQYFNKY
uniref:glycosyltransferase n=1 Tax=Halpernia sp. TaxID=2782209 RepID=UPI003A951166